MWSIFKIKRSNCVFLAAIILVNQNGIFGDEQYEYDTVGIPF